MEKAASEFGLRQERSAITAYYRFTTQQYGERREPKRLLRVELDRDFRDDPSAWLQLARTDDAKREVVNRLVSLEKLLHANLQRLVSK